VKLHGVSIDGYGKFAGRELSFSPGLQIIIGPNEQGKSTVRSFIGDMLYGQKRSASHRLFDESNELRTPWNNPDCYGGRLTYELSDGTVIEVVRNFDRRREQVQVFDQASGKEITQDFELLRNKEVDFASKHLGLSKDVFLNSATITHFSLEHLGDTDALKQIREKLLSLADTGAEEHSAESTLAILRDRIEIIGQPSARTKPLPSARSTLLLLDQELGAAREREAEVAKVAEERRALLADTAGLREERLEVEGRMQHLQHLERKQQLDRAEDLAAQIDAATQACFNLGPVREFPVETVPQVQAAEQNLDRLRTQLKRTRQEHQSTLDQLQAERRHLNDAGGPGGELPEELETRFTDLNAAVQHSTQRLEEAQAALEEAEARLTVSQENLAKLPDFSRIASDPVEWITQLASSFDAARRSREDESQALSEIKRDVNARRKDIAASHTVFKDVEEFSDKARDYDLRRRVQEQEASRAQTNLSALEAQRGDIADSMPGMLLLSGLCGTGIVAILAAYFSTNNFNVLYAGGVILLAMLYFLGSYLYARTRLKEIDATLANNGIPPGDEAEAAEGDDLIDRLLVEAGCETVRELEAAYDQYREASAELSARVHMLREQEARTEEAEERVPKLLDHLRETFRQVSIEIDAEEDVQRAAGSVIARYQEYREAKRNIADSHSQIDRQGKEMARLEELRTRDQRALSEVEAEVRALMSQAGFAPAEGQTTATALRAFRNSISAHREHRARADLLQDRAHALERQVNQEELEIEKGEQELARLLAHAGVSTVEDYRALAEKARTYREHWSQRARLQEQLDALLGGRDLSALREEVAGLDVPSEAPTETREALQDRLEDLSGRIEGNLEREHALHIAMTEKAAGSRSINEIEEARAVVARRVADLELELEATSYAMAVIDEIARDKHARIAPRLAERASTHLKEITGGGYQEIDLARDLTIRVRIPDTNELHETPEKSLSKGTVDQIYLALRLAMVQCISDVGEPIPMLLDDPFANYDDARLARTLQLIANISAANQVLLFTCREDVVRAAETVGAPVIRL
jgi:uncharacterized protein YhaN